MTKIEILATINEVFKENFCDDSIVVTAQTTSDDVPAWDSIEHINLIIEIEERFQMKFQMQEITGMRDVGEMLDIIAERTLL